MCGAILEKDATDDSSLYCPQCGEDYDRVVWLEEIAEWQRARIAELEAVVNALDSIGSIRLLRNHAGRWEWMTHCNGKMGRDYPTASDAILAATEAAKEKK